MADPIVVVGASTAGGSAATTLRQEGSDGRVALIGAEPHPPYERPPLSKAYLQGHTSMEELWLQPEGHWAEHDIDTRFGVPATRVDPGRRVVELADGEQIGYDQLLIATGGRVRRPPIPGIDLAGVHGLRDIADADAIRQRAASVQRAVVVGLGFIGCEVAASLRGMGLDVVAVEPQPAPLAHALGEEVAAAVAELHREHGVELVLNDGVDHFDGEARFEAVVTREGRRLEGDLAVIGLGMEPVTDLVDGTGVLVDDGIVVDDLCRTSVAGVYAAGDVARHYHPLLDRSVRVEHWQHALKQGAAAARAMLGVGEPYRDVHWFWSDQYDTTIHSAGVPQDWDELIVRGDLAAQRGTAFYLAEGRLEAAVALNRPRDVRAATRLIAAGARIDPRELGDEDVDLRELVRRAQGSA